MGPDAKVIQHAIVMFARSWQSLAVVRSLGKRGVRIYAGDTIKYGPATFSKYVSESFVYPDPYDELKFIKFLIRKCKEIKSKFGGEIMLIPIHEETYILAKHLDSFPDYVHAVLNESGIMQRIQNKGELIPLAIKNKVQIPPSWYLKNTGEALKLTDKLNFPVFVKSPEGCASVGIYKAENKKEFQKIVKRLKTSLVIQESVEGNDYCCCALYDEGIAIAMTTYTALQTYPIRGGTTVYRKTVSSPQIEREAHKLLSGLRWNGVAELDFRIEEKTGRAFLIEVNPRFWGGLNQAIKSNIDYPYLLWRMAEGHKLDRIINISDNIKTGNMIGVLRATIEEMSDIQKFFPALKKMYDEPNITNFFRMVKSIPAVLPIYKRYFVRNFLRKKMVDDIWTSGDPKVLAGILFPLAVYAKYGRISEKLLFSSSGRLK